MIRNLNILSYVSGLGVLSSVLLLVGVVWTGLDPEHMPPSRTFCDPDAGCTGSLLRPSPTVLERWQSLPVVAGLILVCFAGHAVLPTLRNDMADRRQYGRMIDYTYAVVTTCYIVIAIAGYLMFGGAAQDQITLNLGASLVSQMTVWVVAVTPLTKFALDMAPIALGLEGFLAVAFRLPADGALFSVASALIRTILVGLALLIVVAVPDFALVLGVLGSACSFTVTIAFPCACYLRLYWDEIGFWERALNLALAWLGAVCAVGGTVAAVLYPEARV